MAQNIYDENGRVVGTIKSEREATDDDIAAFAENIGCLAILVLGVLFFFGGAPWIVTVISFCIPEEIPPLFFCFFAIPIIIATIVLGGRIIEENKKSVWGAFWRIALADIGAGTVGGFVAGLLFGIIDLDEAFEGFMYVVSYSAWFAVVPTVIVAWKVYKNRKKR